jgi:hypothetical protein
MASRLLAGASWATSSVAGVARHLAWYVSYQLDLGDGARVDERFEARRGRRTGGEAGRATRRPR